MGGRPRPAARTVARIVEDAVRVGRFFRISFQRTLRIPDDGRTYPLPPGFGRFPVRRVRDFAARLPVAWRRRGGVFIAMYQREALWLAFEGVGWHPVAVQIGAGGVNAVSGGSWPEKLSEAPQNYLVCPDQPWLDGINTRRRIVRQFVAMPLGGGATVEEQLTGRASRGGIQVRVFDAKPGRFPSTPPRGRSVPDGLPFAHPANAATMGLGAGGQMRQALYPDPYGVRTWNRAAAGTLEVHILNAAQFSLVTGEEMPPTPISAKTYTDLGLPWFELYDDALGAVQGSRRLARVRSTRELDARAGKATPEDRVTIAPERVRRIRPRRAR